MKASKLPTMWKSKGDSTVLGTYLSPNADAFYCHSTGRCWVCINGEEEVDFSCFTRSEWMFEVAPLLSEVLLKVQKVTS